MCEGVKEIYDYLIVEMQNKKVNMPLCDAVNSNSFFINH